MIIIGVEFGQRRSPSAICVATNPLRTSTGHEERHFLIRGLERLGAGTTFPALASRLSEMRDGASKQAPRERIAIYVNATGVGDPLVQLPQFRAPRAVRGRQLAEGAVLILIGLVRKVVVAQ